MKPKKLTNIFNDFFVNTTILVIPKIVATSTRNPFKVIYFLGCILSVILFGRVVFNSLQKFLRYEVDTVNNFQTTCIFLCTFLIIYF